MCIKIFAFSYSEDPQRVLRICIASNSKVWLEWSIQGLFAVICISTFLCSAGKQGASIDAKVIQAQYNSILPGHLFSSCLLTYPWAWAPSTSSIIQWWGAQESYLITFLCDISHLGLFVSCHMEWANDMGPSVLHTGKISFYRHKIVFHGSKFPSWSTYRVLPTSTSKINLWVLKNNTFGFFIAKSHDSQIKDASHSAAFRGVRQNVAGLWLHM